MKNENHFHVTNRTRKFYCKMCLFQLLLLLLLLLHHLLLLHLLSLLLLLIPPHQFILCLKQAAPHRQNMTILGISPLFDIIQSQEQKKDVIN